MFIAVHESLAQVLLFLTQNTYIIRRRMGANP
jgi:hypothetical protein